MSSRVLWRVAVLVACLCVALGPWLPDAHMGAGVAVMFDGAMILVAAYLWGLNEHY